jgi:predicted acyl esterase
VARRVTSTPPWLITWLERQADGPYWRHGSVRASPGRTAVAACRRSSAIGCPTMLIAGWADGYRNISFRAVRALSSQGTPVSCCSAPGPTEARRAPRPARSSTTCR